MFDWIPGPIAALMGTALIAFITVAGIKATTYKKDGKSSGDEKKE